MRNTHRNGGPKIGRNFLEVLLWAGNSDSEPGGQSTRPKGVSVIRDWVTGE